MPTEQQVSAAVIGAVNAALPLTTRAYSPSKVPPTPPNEYLVVVVVRRSGGSPRAGRYVTTGWAAYVTAVSRISDGNASNSLDKADGALTNSVLEVAGLNSTPVKFENAREVGPDDGSFSGARQYQFAI